MPRPVHSLCVLMSAALAIASPASAQAIAPPTPPGEQPPPRGLGLLISGIAATTMGCIFVVTAAGELAPYRAAEGVEDLEGSDTAGLAGIGLGIGVAGMIAGLIMLPIGAVRLHRYRAWGRARARPIVNRSA